jgi:hypothetical protein
MTLSSPHTRVEPLSTATAFSAPLILRTLHPIIREVLQIRLESHRAEPARLLKVPIFDT